MKKEFELLDYQKKGVEFLIAHKRGYLADEMGLGKTVQTIAACDELSASRILIFCPAIARVNWQREYDKFSSRPKTIERIEKRNQKLSTKQNTLTICSYDLAPYLLKNASQVEWDILICDEAHYLKNLESKRTQVILGKEGFIGKTKSHVWMLSGTPCPNHVGELWPILFVFGKTDLNFEAFVRQYCTFYNFTPKGKRARYLQPKVCVTGTQKEKIPEIRKILGDFMVRRLKKKVLKDLPPLNIYTQFVESNPIDFDNGDPSLIKYIIGGQDRRHEYFESVKNQEAIVENLIQEAGRGRNFSQGLAALSPSLPTLRYHHGLSKMKSVLALLQDELKRKAYKKIVVFAFHRTVIETLRTGLSEYHPLVLYGKTPANKRQDRIDRFQKLHYHKVFIANITSAGTAVNLTAADQILFAEWDWVPGNNAQAIMRCHRIGQDNPVNVRFCCVPDSIDEKILGSVKRKTKELTKIFD